MANVPPNWYPDPENDSWERYWNGAFWTEMRRPAPGSIRPNGPGAHGGEARNEASTGPTGGPSMPVVLRPHEPSRRGTGGRLVKTLRWMRAHKVLSAVGIVLLLAMFGAAVPEEPDTGRAAVADGARSGGGEETAETVESPPDQHDVWRTNYRDAEGKIFRALAREHPSYRHPSDAENESVSTCDEMAERRGLKQRTRNATVRWGGFGEQPNREEVATVLGLVTKHVCPEVAKVHDKQVATKDAAEQRKADRKAARREARRMEAEKRRAREQRQERREAAREERRLEREAQRQAEQDAQQSAPPVAPEGPGESVYYENCTAVEDAGAAPIYAGDPGFGSHLDRDGDGVACEQ